MHFALNRTGVLFLGKAETLLQPRATCSRPTDLKRAVLPQGRPADPPRDRSSDVGAGLLGADAASTPSATGCARRPCSGQPGRAHRHRRRGQPRLANHRAEALFNLRQRTSAGRSRTSSSPTARWSCGPTSSRRSPSGARSSLRDVEWNRTGGEQTYLDVQIIPLLETGGDGPTASRSSSRTSPRYRRLQLELEYANRQLETAYEELQSTNEELETTNEELQSTVEELETTNEELQSTNEELETMNEELQSMNDELHDINEELRLRTVEVGAVNAFMEAVLAGLRAAVARGRPGPAGPGLEPAGGGPLGRARATRRSGGTCSASTSAFRWSSSSRCCGTSSRASSRGRSRRWYCRR